MHGETPAQRAAGGNHVDASILPCIKNPVKEKVPRSVKIDPHTPAPAAPAAVTAKPHAGTKRSSYDKERKKRGVSFIAAKNARSASRRGTFTSANIIPHNGCTEVVLELLKQPVNVQEVKRLATLRPGSVNLANENGETAMHYATQVVDSKWTQSELVQLFLKKESCIYLPDLRRRTPIDCAMGGGKKSTCFHAVSDAIRAYQQAGEGRVPFYNEYEAAVSDGGFHAFSQVFKGSDDTPLLYSASPSGLRVYDLSHTRTTLLQHYPGLDMQRFRTSLEPGKLTADQELLFADSGAILRFRRVKQKAQESTRCDSFKHKYRSPLRSASEDPVLSDPLRARLESRNSAVADRQSVRQLSRSGSRGTWVSDLMDDQSPLPSPVGSVSAGHFFSTVGVAMSPKTRVYRDGMCPYRGTKESESAGLTLEVVVEHTTPFLGSYADSGEPCCDIYPMYWGPSAATLQAGDSASQRFEFRIVTIIPTPENTFFSCGHLLADPHWVSRYCHTAKRGVSGRPASLKQVGNGDYVCLSDTDGPDRVVVFSPNLGHAFYPVHLSSLARPVSLTSRTVRDVNITDGEIPLVAICTTQSIEVHKLTLSKTELALEKADHGNDQQAGGHHTSVLCYHIHNSTTGGQYACALAQAGHKLVIFRGGVSCVDICVCDTLSDKCHYICKSNAVRELGERGTANVRAEVSPDGRWVLRANASGVSTMMRWAAVEACIPSDAKKRVNMTFSPTSYVPMSVEMLAVPAPTGKVTLVFTDVQSSTQLWEQEPAAMQDALELHNRLLRRIMLRFCGYEVKTEGDAFMVAFNHAIDALNWCLVSQLLLMMLHYPDPILRLFPAIESDYDAASLSQAELNDAEEEEEDIRETVMGIGGDAIPLIETSFRKFQWRGLRVRMGIHSCTPLCKPDPGTQRMDYFGPPVNLSARISGHGKGGQVVVSQEVYNELGLDSQSDSKKHICDMAITPLGLVRLKGIREPKELYDVLPESAKQRTAHFEMKEAEKEASTFPDQSPRSETGSPHLDPAERSPKYSGSAIRRIRYGTPFVPEDHCRTCDYAFVDASHMFCGVCGTRRIFDLSNL